MSTPGRRTLPTVQELLDSPRLQGLLQQLNPTLVMTKARGVLDDVKRELQEAAHEQRLPNLAELADRVARRILPAAASDNQPTINATGLWAGEFGLPSGTSSPLRLCVPLADAALAEIAALASDYQMGERADTRQAASDPAERLVAELAGGEAALICSQLAAATLASLTTLTTDKGLIVARQQMVELPDGWALPKLLAESGLKVREVGTADQVTSDDYAAALSASGGAVLCMVVDGQEPTGASSSVTLTQALEAQQAQLTELAALAHRAAVPLVALMPRSYLSDVAPLVLPMAPQVRQTLAAGATLVIADGQRNLGGPPCGLLVGNAEQIAQVAAGPQWPLWRADRLTRAALRGTLLQWRNPLLARQQIPLVSLMATSSTNLRIRAERLAQQIATSELVEQAVAVEVQRQNPSAHGLPSSPGCRPAVSWAVEIKPEHMTTQQFNDQLLAQPQAVLARFDERHLWLDLGSVFPRQDGLLVSKLVKPPTEYTPQ